MGGRGQAGRTRVAATRSRGDVSSGSIQTRRHDAIAWRLFKRLNSNSTPRRDRAARARAHAKQSSKARCDRVARARTHLANYVAEAGRVVAFEF